MPIPTFVIYELIVRIYQLQPAIGSYASHTFNTSGAVIITSTGTFRIRKAILNRQFKDPELVFDADLLHIVNRVTAANTHHGNV